VLYRLIHASRFPSRREDSGQSPIEKYYQESIETGNRIRDGLSLAVKESMVALGNGFLQHPDNEELREKLRNKNITPKQYYDQLRRLVYRLLFLMVTEERDLIYDPEDKTEKTAGQKNIYLKYYSIARLRKLSQKRYLYEKQYIDIWQGLMNTFLLFEEGVKGPKLGIKPLAGDLFSSRAIPDIESCTISNDLLLECLRNLNEFQDKDSKTLVPINYRALDVEELGSVYEGLLELHPVIEYLESSNPTNIRFTFHGGTERKTTGSYYTRPELVNELIKSALIPVIEERLKENAGNTTAQAKALLKLKVCDAAAGSGHMLLAAARTIAWYLARVQNGEENPAPSVYRKCLREVIQHCIYAVDYNPDAVELCKLALWLEGHNSGKPLSFLDHKIRNGNSLVGVTDLSVLQKGIPDDAFNPVTGDDKKICQELKKENAKYNKTKQATLDFDQTDKIDTSAFTGDYKELENIQQDDVEGVKQVKTKFEKFRNNHTWFKDWRACNLWTAAFFWNYAEENKQAAPNSERLAKFLKNPAAAFSLMIGKSDALSMEHKFFHWPLEFPDVFEQGGFDVMLGNPPWERIKLQEKEFFANRNPEISKATNKSEREKLIKELGIKNPNLKIEFQNALHAADAQSKFLRECGRFPLTSVGDINTYSVFTELFCSTINKVGKAGIIIPTGIATDSSTQAFFSFLVDNQRLSELLGFENEEFIFPNVHHAYKFCLLTITGEINISQKARFSFLNRNISQLGIDERNFELTKEDIASINPNTKTAPVFRTKKDFELTKKLYSKHPVLSNEGSQINEWGVTFCRMFDMSLDSNYFLKENSKTHSLLYEAKMLFQYDHRYSTYENATEANIKQGTLPQLTEEQHQDPNKLLIPNYWVEKAIVKYRLNALSYNKKYLLCFRGITSSNLEKTLVSAFLPISAVGNSSPAIITEANVINDLLLNASFNSIVADFILRQKISGNNLNFFLLKQLAIPAPSYYTRLDVTFIIPIVVELSYNAWDIKPLVDDVWKEADADLKAAITKQREENKEVTGGHEWAPPEWCEIDETGCPVPPFKWDESRRAVLKAELDAIYAKLYGLTTEELRYILDPQDVYGPDFPGETFRVLKDKETKLYGEYRTRRLVLKAWERLNKEN
jgi:hypothetical protein